MINLCGDFTNVEGKTKIQSVQGRSIGLAGMCQVLNHEILCIRL